MKEIAFTKNEKIASVHILDLGENKLIECVESLQPPNPIDKKWILIISTMFGCPVGCLICDAGGSFSGILSKKEIFDQIDFLVKKKFPNGIIPVEQLKIQFSRMGEPSLNVNILDVLSELPFRYKVARIMPSISTIAPNGSERFFESLIEIKNNLYSEGKFQLQFSLHSTDELQRDKLIPIKKWGLEKIANYGERFFTSGDRKITLNFALINESYINADVLKNYFDQRKFLIKITPVNPTYKSLENNIESFIKYNEVNRNYHILNILEKKGYETILSIGEWEENLIGSNCGQYLQKHIKSNTYELKNGYQYKIIRNKVKI